MKRRGSALIFVIGILFATGVVLLATSEISMSAERRFQRELTETQNEATLNGLDAFAQASAMKRDLTVPSSTSVVIGMRAYPVSFAFGSIPRTIQATTTLSRNGTSRTYRKLLPSRAVSHPAYYAVWAHNGIDLGTGVLETFGSNAAVHSNAAITVSATSTIQGDLSSTGSLSGGSCSGNLMNTAPAQTRFLINPADYASGQTPWPMANLSNLTFTSTMAPSPYQRFYRNANTTLVGGTVSGRGIVFVAGDLDITGNMTYANATSRLIVICTGNIRIAGGRTIVGTYFAGGDIRTSSTGKVTVTRGNLIANGQIFTGNSDLAVTVDRGIWEDRTQGQRHILPGFWPTLTAGLIDGTL